MLTGQPKPVLDIGDVHTVQSNQQRQCPAQRSYSNNSDRLYMLTVGQFKVSFTFQHVQARATLLTVYIVGVS